MAIKAYTGLPRSGKSYEVVVNVIIAALRQGRRVVSNIAGLNYEAMCQVLYAEGVPQESIGVLVSVSHEQVAEPLFWRADTDDAEGVQSFIQPGDVVALDEIWRFWKRRGDVHPRTMNFMRMHGHFAHPVTGYTCDVAIITQHVRDINENVRAVVESTYLMVKNTKLGSDKSYVVHIYDRDEVRKSALIRTLPPRFYKAEYFPCYKSHSARKDGDALAQEVGPDKRGNVLAGPLFRVVIPLAVVAIGVSTWSIWHFFHRAPASGGSSSVAASSVVAAQALADGVALPAGVRRGYAMPYGDWSKAWRVVGVLRYKSFVSVVMEDGGGAVRSVDMPRGVREFALGEQVSLPEGGTAVSWVVFSADKSGARK